MNEKMKFKLRILRIEEMALIKIATSLWNRIDIKICKSFQPNSLNERYEDICKRSEKRRIEWQKLESKVMDEVLKMCLPQSLKRKVLGCIKPIGLEIFSWIENHVVDEYLAVRLPSEFLWTSHGTIDKKKTAEALVSDEEMHIAKRYKLACIYCLENDVKILFDKIFKAPMMFSEGVLEYTVKQHSLVEFWNCYLKGDLAKLTDGFIPFLWPFLKAIFSNKAATEYFFHKLTLLQKKNILVYAAELLMSIRESKRLYVIDDYVDTLHFLLSQMDSKQLIEIYNKQSGVILESFLYFPRQGYFLETADYLKNVLSTVQNNYIAFHVIHKINNGFKDCDYPKLIQDFCQLVPEAHKSLVRPMMATPYLAFESRSRRLE